MNENKIKNIDTFIENPVFTVDKTGEIKVVDKGQTKIWGYYRDELIGMNIQNILDLSYKNYGLQLICNRIGESQYSGNSFSVVILSKYGEKIKVKLTVEDKGECFKVELSKEFEYYKLAAS